MPPIRKITLWTLTITITLLGIMIGNFENVRFVVLSSVILFLAIRYLGTLLPLLIYAEGVVYNMFKPVVFGPENLEILERRLVYYDQYSCDDMSDDECGVCYEPYVHPVHKIVKRYVKMVYTFWEEFGMGVVLALSIFVILLIAILVYKWVVSRRHRLRRGYEDLMETINLTELIPEKMAPGSQLFPAQQPTIQCEIYASYDHGDFVYVGQGFRVGINLWTAWHVVCEADELRLYNPKVNQAIVVKNEFKQLSGDVAVLALGDKLSQISLSTGKFAGVAQDQSTTASFVSVTAKGRQSLGLLTPHQGFGLAIYSGSTLAGFSGAPYLVNKQIYGMHLGHQGVNLGYDGAYLSMLERATQESTEDYIYELIGKYGKQDLKIVASSYDPDECWVRYGGKYYVMDRFDAYRAFEDYLEEPEYDVDEAQGEYNVRMSKKDKKRIGTEKTKIEEYYDSVNYDYDTEAAKPVGLPVAPDVMYNDSGNGSVAPAGLSAVAGAGGPSSLARVVVPTSSMLNVSQTPTSSLRKDLVNLVTQLPASTHVQCDEVSNIIPKEQMSSMIRQILETMELERQSRDNGPSFPAKEKLKTTPLPPKKKSKAEKKKFAELAVQKKIEELEKENQQLQKLNQLELKNQQLSKQLNCSTPHLQSTEPGDLK